MSRRSATVRALRDSHLVRIPSDVFVRFLREEPDELFAVARLLIQRLRRSNRSEAAASSVRTIAIIPVGEGREAATFARYLTSVLAERGKARLVAAADVDEGHDDANLTRFLHDLEADHDLLVYLAEREPSTWTDRCLRQADRVVLVGEADADAGLSEVERRVLVRDATSVRAPVDLVLVQAADAAHPRHAPRWLAQRSVGRLHHVRLHSRDDIQRVARAFTGREIALVLSGGGARNRPLRPVPRPRRAGDPHRRCRRLELRIHRVRRVGNGLDLGRAAPDVRR